MQSTTSGWTGLKKLNEFLIFENFWKYCGNYSDSPETGNPVIHKEEEGQLEGVITDAIGFFNWLSCLSKK